ncbi:hypothetical protein [Cohnella silvisoli]|uniref:Uncharacterized protein n=1 Tax=Cohnella silvisoli TaxID=2873699 RepID=A0ABV1L074_9BACL|nr:hypothetical protein [Cohnella silvisoli]MCD9024900.1 hypothetical protein [Cohnella silvisoli]
MGLLAKKIDQHLFVSNRSDKVNETSDVLGLHKPKWINEITVLFPTEDGEQRIMLD